MIENPQTDGQTETAANTVYTIEDRGTVVLAGTEYKVEVQHYLATGGSMTWLLGPRGAMYFLRGYIERGGDTGLRQVISWKSGAPLRRKGNEIRVYQIGDIIEAAK